MKVSATLALFAAAACVASAADVMVHGAQMQTASGAGVDLRVGTHSSQNSATALINKNKVAMDGNTLVARSNVMLSQNDRVALGKKIEEALTKSSMKADDMEDPDATAILTKDVMRVVSGDQTDGALMTKASAVVAAKGDQSALMQRINDFIDTAMTTRTTKAKKAKKTEEDEEQVLQSNTPRGITTLIGTKDIQRQPSAVVNKNLAQSDNQVPISRSVIAPTQNDRVSLRGSKVADILAPASILTTGKIDSDDSDDPEDEKPKKQNEGEDEELEKKKKKKTTPKGKTT